MSSLKELRDLSKSIHEKKKEFQKVQFENKKKEQSRLHDEALKNKSRIQENLGSSSHIYIESFFSRIRFDIIGACALVMIIVVEGYYLHRQGIISSPLQKAKYEVVACKAEDESRNIEAAVEKIEQEIREHKAAETLSQLFSTSNPDKINAFLKETNSLDVKAIVYAKGENCYYASAMTDRDRNVSFKFNHLAGDFKVCAIEIED